MKGDNTNNGDGKECNDWWLTCWRWMIWMLSTAQWGRYTRDRKECETKLEEIRDVAVELSNVMKQNETYRITVEKRHSSLHTKDIISNIADSLSNKVSLENSDWEIIVQILRNKTGISVIAPDTIVHQHQLLTLLILMMTFVSSPTTYLCTSTHQTDLWRHLLLLTPQNYHKSTTNLSTRNHTPTLTSSNSCK